MYRADRGWTDSPLREYHLAKPKPPNHINQIYLEPVMFAQAATVPRLRVLRRTSVLDFEQTKRGVLAIARDLNTNKTREIFTRYLVGCDGAHSKVRRRIGAALSGDSHVCKCNRPTSLRQVCSI